MDIYDESGNGMLRAGTSVDMRDMVDHYIRDSTVYVLKMEEKSVNVMRIDVRFFREGMWLDKVLRQILADIRQIPSDQTILTKKNYTNFSGLDVYAVVQLQSLSDLLCGLLRGIDHHFGIYPDSGYAPRRQDSIEGIHTTKIETLLSALDTLGRSECAI